MRNRKLSVWEECVASDKLVVGQLVEYSKKADTIFRITATVPLAYTSETLYLLEEVCPSDTLSPALIYATESQLTVVGEWEWENPSSKCTHEWVETQGFREVYVDCRKCGAKKEMSND